MEVEYAYLSARESRSSGGLVWEFENQDFDRDLLAVLNILGARGWRLACKDHTYRYIMMKQV